MDWNEYIQMFVGLFAISSPISIVPLYLSYTENIKSHRPRVARTTAIAVSLIAIVSILLGQSILAFFSISVDAFRVAGGILLMFIAFGMLQAHSGRIKHTPEEDEEAIESASVVVVPLAIPLIAGPGVISTIILFNNQTESLTDKIALFIICQLLAMTVWIVLHFAPQIGDRMSQTAMNITTRVMGLILAAMSVEFIVGGLRVLLPGLA